MGSKIYLSETFTAPTGKVLRADPLLPVAGAILLLDGSHSAGGFGSGNPAPGTVFPNVAFDQAASQIGSGSLSTLSPVFNAGSAGAAGCGKERTVKGGLHIAVKQDLTLVSQNGYSVDLPDALRNYLVAHKDDDFYFSLWHNLTRAAVAPFANPPPLFAIGTASGSLISNYLTLMDSQDNKPTATRLGSRNSRSFNTVGETFRSVGSSVFTGTPTGGPPALQARALWWGAIGAYSVLAGTDDPLSWVLYRAYIENLTVSGRTYAEVEALDYAMYQAAFSAGGKFYGDTLTAPATLAGA